jgi:hypothetical protein
MVSEISLELVLISNHRIYSAVLLKISDHLFFVKVVTYRENSCILLTISEFDIGLLRASPRRAPFPDSWTLAKVTLDGLLEVLPFGDGDHRYHNVLRDNFG